jgi:signal transduction histidine kinase
LPPARAAAVAVAVTEQDDGLRFQVHDTGVGFTSDAVPAGSGVRRAK